MTAHSRAIAVVIPARNAGDTLDACLRALRTEGIPAADRQLIVVDDGSADRTAEIARCHGAVVLESGGAGPAAARNLGARNADAEILLFLDADTVPLEGWLEAMLRPFEDPDIVAVKGRYVTQQRGLVPRFAQIEFEEKYARLARASEVDFVDTATAAYRKSVFLEAGGFDESFPAQSAEDVDLAFRLASRGARFAFSSAARVQHAHAESLAGFLHKKARYGFFRATVYSRFPRKLGGDSYTPPWMPVQIGTSWLSVLAMVGYRRGWPGARPLLVASCLGFLAASWPLLHRAYVSDRELLPGVLPLAFLRALAQGAGLALGALSVAGRARRSGWPKP